LFVYLILAPFLPEAQLNEIFGENLLKKESLQPDLLSLLGQTRQKPFECVGTMEEARAAFAAVQGQLAPAQKLLREWNAAHNIPARFLPAAERMLAYVSATA
jgi:hypothetical protein